MLEMAPLFIWLCTDHGGWSLFKLRPCICIFYYMWSLIFEAHHTAPDFIWKCVILGLKCFFTQGPRQGRSQRKGAGSAGSRHESVHFSDRLMSPGMEVRAERSKCLYGNKMCLLRKKKINRAGSAGYWFIDEVCGT